MIHGHPSSIVDIVEAAPAAVAPPGWTVGRQLAIGGTSVVYAVERAGTAAVMKLARFRQRDVHARFAIEADVLRAIGPPCTPAYIDHGTLDHHPYLIMEHVPGETLATWMSRTGERGGLGEILALLTRIAGALSALHQAGFVHRDFKPENVVIGTKGVRLLDFGLVKPLRTQAQNLTQIGCVVGTVHYLAPEQIRTGGVVDHRADIYSFGVVAFEMLTARPPFIGERKAIEYQHQVVRPPTIGEVRQVPQELEDIVQACLAKQVESRPQTVAELQARLTRVLGEIGTLRGVGGSRPAAAVKPIGVQAPVVLAMIEGGDPVAVTRAITEVQGIVVRQRGVGILAAFTHDHDAPMAVAVAACRALARERCRMVIHTTNALVRRSAQGKQTVYAHDIDHPDDWLPRTPFTGLVLTAAAAQVVATGVTASELAGFYRVTEREQTDVTDTRTVPTLVGRTQLVQTLVGELASGRGVLINLAGREGAGKTRVLDAVVERLRTQGRDVLAVRARRRLAGDRPDDERLVEALGGGATIDEALHHAAARGVILAVDDVQHLSTVARDALVRPDLALARIVVSREPVIEVVAGDVRRIAIELPPLSYPEASILLRELLRPAQLIPDVLIERLAIRGTGNPALLVALALDIKRRGAVRRQPGAEDWYVAADELDTLLAPPGAEWLAMRSLEDLPPELVPLVRMSAALGPRFTADELAAVTRVSDASARLESLVRDHVLIERNGWFEHADPTLQDSIYQYASDERALVHHRALAYWLANRSANVVGWLARIAHHATGAGEVTIAATAWIALAREARRRGEVAYADDLLARASGVLAAQTTPLVVEAARALDTQANAPITEA